MSAYQWLWRFSPLIFGLAFTYLLTKLTEPAAAGIALALLAFKIFPDTGLHHLVPSNLTMAGAVVVWARIISRQGWAPWTLGLSAILLPALHPVGVLYTVVSHSVGAGPGQTCRSPEGPAHGGFHGPDPQLHLSDLFLAKGYVPGAFYFDSSCA